MLFMDWIFNNKIDDENKFKKAYDKFIYIIVILCPIVNLPQLLRIWINKSAEDVSLLSWISFTIISITWFIQGILHKKRPIIIMNFFLVIVQALIALGAFLYG